MPNSPEEMTTPLTEREEFVQQFERDLVSAIEELIQTDPTQDKAKLMAGIKAAKFLAGAEYGIAETRPGTEVVDPYDLLANAVERETTDMTEDDVAFLSALMKNIDIREIMAPGISARIKQTYREHPIRLGNYF